MSGRGSMSTAAWVVLAVLAIPAARADGDAPAMNPIERILRAGERLAPIVDDAGRYRLQVVLGLIEAGGAGRTRLVQHGFRADAEYFYPASAVKLCAAVTALEELTALAAATGLAIDESTPLTYYPLFADETIESADESNLEGGRITVGHEIRKLFLVSDNTAFNRLYELVGPDAIHRSMHRAGLETAWIIHRLSELRTAEENRMLPRIELWGRGFHHRIAERNAPPAPDPPPAAGIEIGRGYLADGERVDGPMDFSGKNRMSLADLQRALAKVVRPDVDAGGEAFRLTERQRSSMLEAMRQVPRQSANPVYDPRDYPDHHVKFLLPGLERRLPRERLAILNKVGQAYGFSIENAYVEDSETGRAFFLAAVIYTNSDGILNDDRYEYQEVADPFFADLGEAVARALWND